MALEHLARDLEVDGVDVVEQAWGEEASDMEDEPGEDDESDGAGVPAGGGGLGGCGLGVGLNQAGANLWDGSSVAWLKVRLPTIA